MNRKEVKQILKAAAERNPKAYSDLREIYATSDMPYEEFIAHMKIIANASQTAKSKDRWF